MNVQKQTQWLSMGLLVVSVLALLVGVFTAANAPQKAKISGGEKSDGKLLSAISEIAKTNHLMFIDLSGPIVMQTEEGGLLGSSESNAVTARKALEEALEDDSVKGVLLAINSPGGTVGMSQELHAAVTRLEKTKPVVAYFGDVAASGGYYTACAATKIVSNPGTLTGSIGVIISTLNFKELLQDKLGVHSHTIKSGKFKDLLNPYREIRAEELALVQQMIDVSYGQFLGAVLEGRTRYVEDPVKKKALEEKIRSVADGRVLVGTEAQKMGLVDEIGDIDTAHELLSRMAKERFKLKGKDRLPLEEYSSSKSLLEYLGISAQAPQPPTAGWDRLLPFSLRYPNQPLWMME